MHVRVCMCACVCVCVLLSFSQALAARRNCMYCESLSASRPNSAWTPTPLQACRSLLPVLGRALAGQSALSPSPLRRRRRQARSQSGSGAAVWCEGRYVVDANVSGLVIGSGSIRWGKNAFRMHLVIRVVVAGICGNVQRANVHVDHPAVCNPWEGAQDFFFFLERPISCEAGRTLRLQQQIRLRSRDWYGSEGFGLAMSHGDWGVANHARLLRKVDGQEEFSLQSLVLAEMRPRDLFSRRRSQPTGAPPWNSRRPPHCQ